jgi:plastin-1
MLKWANTTAQKAKPGVRPIRSFKDPSITTGLFFLDLLDAIRPGIVDPALVENVSDNGDPELKRQNGKRSHFVDRRLLTLYVYSQTCDFNREEDERFNLFSSRRHCGC